MILKIVIRIFALAFIAWGFNAIFTKFIWPDELKKEGPELQKLLRISDSCDVIYFGESSNISYDPVKDLAAGETTSISGLIAKFASNMVVGDITHQAYHAGIYLSLIKRIPKNSKVKTIIVTLNLRTLDQACINSGLETALQKQALYYANQPPVWIHLRAALNDYDNVSEYERDHQMWKQWATDKLELEGIKFPYPTIKTWCEAVKFPLTDGTEDMPKRTLADHYIKAYAFIVDTNNPRIKDLNEIIEICREKRIRLVFNLLAENTHYADSLVGKSLVELIKYNRNFMVSRYQRYGVTVVDNLEAVEGKDYTDQNWTTEHYNYTGRKIIAGNLAKVLK
ncbi:MAG: hypothetical protein ACKVQB_09045 [Bacteroidia bacterium]